MPQTSTSPSVLKTTTPFTCHGSHRLHPKLPEDWKLNMLSPMLDRPATSFLTLWQLTTIHSTSKFTHTRRTQLILRLCTGLQRTPLSSSAQTTPCSVSSNQTLTLTSSSVLERGRVASSYKMVTNTQCTQTITIWKICGKVQREPSSSVRMVSSHWSLLRIPEPTERWWPLT